MVDEESPAPVNASRRLEELLFSYQKGDSGAAAALVHAVSPLFLRYCLARGDRREDAEDTLQEIWLRVHRARHTYHADAPALPWLYAICRHTWLDARRQRFRKLAREVQVEELPEPLAAGGGPDLLPDLNRLLLALPAPQREVLLLLKGSEMSVKEVAEATSSTVSAVKQRAHRAYTQLRSFLEEHARGR